MMQIKKEREENNMTLKERQKEEAVKRMKILKIDNEVIESFKKDGKVFYSERMDRTFDGMLFWLENDESYMEIKDKVEKDGYLVYHAQLSHSEIGDMLSMLVVSDCEDEWDENKEMLKEEGGAYVYVANLDCPMYSEYGIIEVVPKNGGITRLN